MSAREDLGAQFARITRRLMTLEAPLLEKHGVTMWEYAVLLRLRTAAAETQLELAQRIGYDKTRLIALLDALKRRGLVQRERAAGDGRARTVKLTREGRAKLAAVQHDVHRMEDRLFSPRTRAELQILLERVDAAAQAPK